MRWKLRPRLQQKSRRGRWQDETQNHQSDDEKEVRLVEDGFHAQKGQNAGHEADEQHHTEQRQRQPVQVIHHLLIIVSVFFSFRALKMNREISTALSVSL